MSMLETPINKKLNIFLHDLRPLEPLSDGLLRGMNIAVKDNISVEGWPLSAGSRILDGYVAPYDATVIRKLREAGATLIGKVNLDEFAMGSSTENSAFGPTKNPWDIERVPGGSSGGSAAVIAADLAEVSLGSDTGGSVRQPASFCGVTGFKPTYGAVSRYGLVALASSLDVVGPMARTARKVEHVMSIIAGKDPMDQTTFDYSYQSIDKDISKLRVGLPKQLWDIEMDPEIRASTQILVNFFRSKGATVEDVDLPSLPLALSAYYIILPAEVSANLSRYDGIRYRSSEQSSNLVERYYKTRSKFGKEVKRRILLGAYALSVGHYDAYYQLATKVRQQIIREHQEVFRKVDVLISPTTSTPAFKMGERLKDPVAMYQSDLLTVGANLAGLPAISLPTGFTSSNLPIGSQIIANQLQDNVVLSLARQYQEETDWHLRRPNG